MFGFFRRHLFLYFTKSFYHFLKIISIYITKVMIHSNTEKKIIFRMYNIFTRLLRSFSIFLVFIIFAVPPFPFAFVRRALKSIDFGLTY